jgi:hypothetical protein
MLDWFFSAFGKAVDRVVEGAGHAIADMRHEALGGWFGRNFEPHPTRQKHDLGWTLPDREKGNAPEPQAHEPAKPDREHGIDR